MSGIAVAGSALADNICVIDSFPHEGELTKIVSLSRAIGGCVPNVASDLKTLDPKLDVFAIGKFGQDEERDFILGELKRKGVDVSLCKTASDLRTSFTEVMSVRGGQRTFFTYTGASARFGADDIEWDDLRADMLHLGYFLLLDKVDSGDGEKILQAARERGIVTSIDLVSENSDGYGAILPCLKYVNNLIINELEAERLSGESSPESAAEKLKSLGVIDRVLIHTPKYALCLSARGMTKRASFALGNDFIKGTTGAGDAFCAGALLAIYRRLSDEKILEYATIAATASLSASDAVSGMQSMETLYKKYAKFKRKICL